MEASAREIMSSKLVDVVLLRVEESLGDFKIVGELPSFHLFDTSRRPSESLLLVMNSGIASVAEALRIKIISSEAGMQIAGILLKGKDLSSDTVREVEKLIGIKVLGVVPKDI